MKKVLFAVLAFTAVLFTNNKAEAQIKVGVFDIDAMVSAMPGYRQVDSMLQIFQRDSIGGAYQVYVDEYQRIDSILRFVDSPGVKAKTVTETKLKYDLDQKSRYTSILLGWRDYAQRLYDNRKGILSQSLYQQVATSYNKVLKERGYAVVLKPGTYEFGPRVDNIFIAVAKDLKLTALPQELLVLGVDPDTPSQGQAPAAQPAGGQKPAGAKQGTH